MPRCTVLSRLRQKSHTYPYNITRKITPPLKTNFHADFLDNGEDSNAERYIHGKISTKSVQNPTVFSEWAPLGLRKIGFETRPRALCFLACYIIRVGQKSEARAAEHFDHDPTALFLVEIP